MKLKHFLLLVLPVLLTACPTPPGPKPSSVSYEQVRFSDLPDWPGHTTSVTLQALKQSCKTLIKRSGWNSVCHDIASLNSQNSGEVRNFFETHFVPWQIKDGESKTGLVTGYYEPLLEGSLSKSSSTPYPVYGVPADLNVLDFPVSVRGADQLVIQRVNGTKRWIVVKGKKLPVDGEAIVTPGDFVVDTRTTVLRGRIVGNRFVPYFKRAEIDQGRGVNHAPVLAWVADPVELFFLQVQGSGRVRLKDGSLLRLGYADQNGYQYVSIGKWLVDRGELKLSEASMQGIQAWIKKNPGRQKELFAANPSYVFFKKLDYTDGGPIGALGVPLTDSYSVAVDKRYVPLGTPLYLSTTYPLSSTPLNRIVHAQDTGGAIRGPIRIDFFWGFGQDAGVKAGRMKQQGSVWLLLPKGVRPTSPQVS